MNQVIGRTEPKDQIDRWIAKYVHGCSFIDVGGVGEKSVNERVTWAQRSGASRVVMADIATADS